MNHYSRGFTLIETVIGIVVFAIAMTTVTAVIVPLGVRSVDPILQVRAAELAQSIFNEIASKSFDENSDRNGGLIRCNEDLPAGLAAFPDSVVGERACTPAANLGPDILTGTTLETRADFDDVDDYHGTTLIETAIGSLGPDIASLYQGFTLTITVVYDGNFDGVADTPPVDTADTVVSRAKLITINVTTPSGQTLPFSTYRSNF